jgi:hypothetical protein
VDFHLHMVSTIAGAEDLFAGTVDKYPHQDEIWIWIPDVEQAIVHLKSFLTAFKASPAAVSNEWEVEFLGDNAAMLKECFEESFLRVPYHIVKKNLPIAVMRYKAGTINSRKAMISPYLPKLV